MTVVQTMVEGNTVATKPRPPTNYLVIIIGKCHRVLGEKVLRCFGKDPNTQIKPAEFLQKHQNCNTVGLISESLTSIGRVGVCRSARQ